MYNVFWCILACRERETVVVRSTGLPWWLNGKQFTCQCGRLGFNPWVRNISWRRKWQPTLVFLLGEFPWTEEPGGPQSMRLQCVGHDWATKQSQASQLSSELYIIIPILLLEALGLGSRSRFKLTLSFITLGTWFNLSEPPDPQQKWMGRSHSNEGIILFSSCYSRHLSLLSKSLSFTGLSPWNILRALTKTLQVW